jgi:hypothetical protein
MTALSHPGASTSSRTSWLKKLPLLLPYLGLCFPQLYTRATPAVFGFPFFYWYQFLWVILTSAILAFYYFATKQRPS